MEAQAIKLQKTDSRTSGSLKRASWLAAEVNLLYHSVYATPSRGMFDKARRPHQRASSKSTYIAATTATRPVHDPAPISPLQMTFDFELPPSPFEPTTPNTATSSARQLSDGWPAPSNSKSDSATRITSGESREAGWQAGESVGREAVDSAGGVAAAAAAAEEGGEGRGKQNTLLVRKQSVMSHRLSTNFAFDDLAPMPLPDTSMSRTKDERPKTAHGSHSDDPISGMKMEASLFPMRSDTPVLSQIPSPPLPSMNRSFIDSRDKPYSSQPPKSFATLKGNHSSPNLPGANGKTPVSVSRGPAPIYSNRALVPQASLQELAQSSKYSGSTARPSTHSSSRTAVYPGASTTIGMPYGATADSYPLPQHVKTRPKTLGVTSSVAGVIVPTHHTSSKTTSKSDSRKSVVSKKKGRLLNPMLLLQRRRSSQDPDAVEAERADREAQAQALARQRDVLASGVKIPPPDFDPRIKGKLVHDFSAPREKRHTFDENDMPSPPTMQQSFGNAQPSSPATFPPRHASLVNRGNRSPKEGQRRSTHTPIFVENLDENPESSKRVSSIHAENLENKEFLQRASKHSTATAHSQESAILPPFARRSQMLDPLQASYFQDEDSKRSSDPSSHKGYSSPPSNGGEISPVTARSSGHIAISPISAGPTSPYGSRPVSHLNPALADSNASKLSANDSWRKPATEKTLWPHSIALTAPPQINSITEGSGDNLPVEATNSISHVQKPQYPVRGASITTPRSPGAPETLGALKLEANTASPSTQSVLDRTVDFSAPEQSPRLMQDAATFHTQQAQLKMVEKRASAAGHSRRSAAVPKKNASNASRFSFQFGGESAAQEQALEEKHRKIVSREITDPIVRATSPDEDDDNYFDEDAMDDMDELEMQASSLEQPRPMLHPQSKLGSISNAGTSQSSQYLQQARQALQQPDSDGESLYDDEVPQITDEKDLPYAEHPAFRAHSAMGGNSRHNSMMTDTPDGYWRDSTIDSYMRDSYNPAAAQSRVSRMNPALGSPGLNAGHSQDYLGALDRDSQRCSRPQPPNLGVSGQSQAFLATTTLTKPMLPHRDSGNSERNRAVSGFSFSTLGATPSSEQVDPLDQVHEASKVVGGQGQSAVDDNRPHASTGSLDMQTLSSQTTPKLASAQDDPQSSTSTNRWQISSTGDANQPGWQRDNSALADRFSSPSNKVNRNSSEADTFNPLSTVSDTGFKYSARGANPPSPGKGQYDGGTAGPRISKGESDLQRIGSPSTKTRKNSSPPPNTSGLGLSNFTAFDFGPSLTSTTLASTVADASSSAGQPHNVLNANSPREDGRRPVSHTANATQKSNVTAVPCTDRDSQSGVVPDPRGRQIVPASSPPIHLKKASIATTSPVPPWKKSPETPQQGIGSPSVATTSHREQSELINAARPPSSNNANTMPPAAGMDVIGKSFAKESSESDSHDGKKGFHDGQDDMYFDDGNFGEDFDDGIPAASGFDEDAFDDDNFLYRPNANFNGPQGYGHRQKNSILSLESMGSDGPYPSFAVPNASKALARNSQLMLEDLPIQAPVDPKYIPQRNPSEDAKRLGLSDKAPPVPVSEGNPEALLRMQNSLQKYHAALAEAANRAASEGRFYRQPSVASTIASSANKPDHAVTHLAVDAHSMRDDASMYSQNEDGGEIHMPFGNGKCAVDRSDTQLSHLSQAPGYSPRKMSFDFGFDQSAISDFGGYEDEDDDLVAAANAEVLASDDEGFYGQEFEFYGRPRANSIEAQAFNGGFFGPDGDDGLQRNKSSREPNLTPITERSEFSTRNSFVAGMAGFGPPSAGGYGHPSPAMSRLPITPLVEHDVISFDELRRLRAQTFGGSRRSDKSSSNRSSQHSLSLLSPTIDTSVGNSAGQGYVGNYSAQYGSNPGSGDASIPPGAKPLPLDAGFNFHDSPQSATSSNGNSFALDIDATPKRNTNSVTEPVTAKKAPPRMMSPTRPKSSHSRSGSAADSITYVQEPDSEGSGRPRWVLERRRTSEAGQLELVGREFVQGGWI